MKSRAETNCDNHYETFCLTDSDSSGSIDDSDVTNSTDVLPDKICENKMKRKRKKKVERAPSSQYYASESKPEFNKRKPNNNSMRNNQAILHELEHYKNNNKGNSREIHHRNFKNFDCIIFNSDLHF